MKICSMQKEAQKSDSAKNPVLQFPFVLKENEAVISYTAGNITKYS